MTVKELRKRLEKLPGDALVFGFTGAEIEEVFYDDGGNYVEILPKAS